VFVVKFLTKRIYVTVSVRITDEMRPFYNWFCDNCCT